MCTLTTKVVSMWGNDSPRVHNFFAREERQKQRRGGKGFSNLLGTYIWWWSWKMGVGSSITVDLREFQ